MNDHSQADVGELAGKLIRASSAAYAAGAVRRQLDRHPDAALEYGGSGFEGLRGDTEVRLAGLAEALALGHQDILFLQLSWAKVGLCARGIDVGLLDTNLVCLAEELGERLPARAGAAAVELLQAARRHLAAAPARLPSLIESEAPHRDLARRYLLAVLEGRAEDAIELLARAAQEGVPVEELYRYVLLDGQEELGRMWQRHEIHVAEEHLATFVTVRAMERLRGLAPRAPALGKRVLLATVTGDLHDIGLRAVADHLMWAGWETLVLGASVPAPDLLLGVVDFEPDLLALSASMTLQVRSVREAIAEIRGHPGLDVPILVGGAPFCAIDGLGRTVGADAVGIDARGAVLAAGRLLAPTSR